MSRIHNPYEIPVKFRWTDIPTAICYTIALIALGLALAINLRPLYYLSIEWFGISESTGMNAVVIKENYNALIDYCSPFFKGELVFPSLRSSASGLSHFAEVKTIFNAIYIAGAVSIVFCVLSFIIKSKNNEYNYLKHCAIYSIVLPVILVIASIIDFDTLFLLFHKVVFNNNDWLFDPNTDPIINLLPEAYFLECAIVIAVVVIIGSVIAFVRYGVLKKRKKEVRLLKPQKNYYY